MVDDNRPVNLTVHKNNAVQKKRQALRQEIIDAARELATNSAVSEKISGYGIVVFNEDHDAETYWVSGGVPSRVIGEFLKQSINAAIARKDVKALRDDD